MADLIKKTDTLNQGREKLNTAITDAETAKNISAQADDKATQALTQSESTQTQLDTIVINGDSSVEAAQARVSSTGTAYGTLKQRLDSEYQEVTTQLAQRPLKQHVLKQTTMPPKQGVMSSNPKLVILGELNDEVIVVQYNGSKYVIYRLDTADGDTSATSVGGKWDLIRLKKASLASNAYVAKTIFDNTKTVGTVETLFAPALRNDLENYLFHQMVEESTAEYLSSTGDGLGVAVHSLYNTSAVSSVTWNVKTGTSTKANILLYGSSSSPTSVDILVNGEIVKTLDVSKLNYGFGAHYKLVEFELPLRFIEDETVEVTLRNNDTAGKKLYFSCVNFMLLKDFDGRDIDFYKVFGTSSHFINGTGANDYAIFDHDLQKFVGSYHGGETRLDARMMWYTSTPVYPTMYKQGRFLMRSKSVITDDWAILPQFEIVQITDLNGKGRMVSKFNFDIDGTMDMQFGFKGSMVVEDFYTALTCTDVGFTYIGFPNFEELPAPDQKGYMIANEGYVEQQNLSKSLTLAIRHSKFETENIAISRENGWIQNHATNYKKYYYGAIEKNTDGVLIEQLTFRKALDLKYA